MSKRIPIFLGLLLVIFAVWVLLTHSPFVRGFVERLDHLGYDLQLRTRILTQNELQSNVVAIIDIDDKSLHAVGRWPWPRDKLAKLQDELNKQGAAVVAFDVFFSEKQPNISEVLTRELKQKKLLDDNLAALLKKNVNLFDEDNILAKALEKGQTVLAIGFSPRNETANILPKPLLTLSPIEQKQLDITKESGYIANIPSIQQAAKASGFINIYPDEDGIIRRAPLVLQYKGAVYPSLALQAVLQFLNTTASLNTPTYASKVSLEGVNVGKVTIPTDEKGQVLIPFIGKSYTFPYYSAIDVLNNKLPPDALLGKILFVGTSATGVGDLQATAIANPFPGVEIQATLANGLITNHFSQIPAWIKGAILTISLIFGCIAAFWFPYWGAKSLSALMIVLPPTMLLLNNLLWIKTGLIISLLIPVVLILLIALLNLIYGYLFESRRRERLKEMFGQYVPEKHIDQMLQSASDYGLRGEDREMSVLFADVRNFTSISENLTAAELVRLLNTLFTPMTEIIFKHRGTIDKYVGDLIMAFWGAPLKDKNHAYHAIVSALEMLKKLEPINKEMAANKWPEIKIGIGINSGMMSVGDMGSRYRRNYTVLGDAVNLASRVESLSKFYGVNLIVTEFTQHNQPKFVFRKLDKVRVKGKNKGIDIFEVIGMQAQITPESQAELEQYHVALNFYYQQKWDDALALFTQLQQQNDHKIYQIYIDRIHDAKKHPLPSDWDGVFTHHSK